MAEPDSNQKMVLETISEWGPSTYLQWRKIQRGVKGYFRLTDGQCQTYFTQTILDGFLVPLGCHKAPSQASHGGQAVVWGLYNPRKYKHPKHIYLGTGKKRKWCKELEKTSGVSCCCCELLPLPDDGVDPQQEWVVGHLWKPKS